MDGKTRHGSGGDGFVGLSGGWEGATMARVEREVASKLAEIGEYVVDLQDIVETRSRLIHTCRRAAMSHCIVHVRNELYSSIDHTYSVCRHMVLIDRTSRPKKALTVLLDQVSRSRCH